MEPRAIKSAVWWVLFIGGWCALAADMQFVGTALFICAILQPWPWRRLWSRIVAFFNPPDDDWDGRQW